MHVCVYNMRVYACVCVYNVRVYECVYVYNVRVYECVYVYNVRVYACMCLRVRVFLHIANNLKTKTQLSANTLTYMHEEAHTQEYTYSATNTGTHIRTCKHKINIPCIIHWL